MTVGHHGGVDVVHDDDGLDVDVDVDVWNVVLSCIYVSVVTVSYLNVPCARYTVHECKDNRSQ